MPELPSLAGCDSLKSTTSAHCPAFTANWDPFGVGDDCFRLLVSDELPEALRTILSMDTTSFFVHPDFNGARKKVSPQDILIQAFLMSYREILGAQSEVIRDLGFIHIADLMDIGELFRYYGDRDKEASYIGSVHFFLIWFGHLMSYYHTQGSDGPTTYFRDFYDFILQPDVTLLPKTMSFEAHLPRLDGTVVIVFDLIGEKTRITMPNFIDTENGHRWFSDVLTTENPFAQHGALNFLLPTGYRGHIWPMINVVEIILENPMRGGQHCFSANITVRAGDTSAKVGELLTHLS